MNEYCYGMDELMEWRGVKKNRMTVCTDDISEPIEM
jgi:hypothetical protein